MEKRPVSLTVIAVILIVFAVLGLIGVFMIGMVPAMTASMAQMKISLPLYQAWGVLGAIVTIVCAYGILKGLPWSRVLYLVWGVIGLAVSAYISPTKGSVVLALVILVVVCVFLWTNAANDWFQARGLMLKRETQPLTSR
jgi:hypothetical protein